MSLGAPLTYLLPKFDAGRSPSFKYLFGKISVSCSVWLFGTRAFATENKLG